MQRVGCHSKSRPAALLLGHSALRGTATLSHGSASSPGHTGAAGPPLSPLQKASVSLLPPGLPSRVWRGSSGAGLEQVSPSNFGCRETLAGMHSSVPTRCPRSRGPTRLDRGLFAIWRLLGRGELSTKGAQPGMQGEGSDVPTATGRNIWDEATLPSPSSPLGSRAPVTTPAHSPQPAAHTLRISQPARAEPMHSRQCAGAPSQLGTGERMTHPLLLLRWEPGGSPLVPASQLGTGSLESQSRHDPVVPLRAPGTT